MDYKIKDLIQIWFDNYKADHKLQNDISDHTKNKDNNWKKFIIKNIRKENKN